MSETDPLLLASQLCSRLCHDMLSPVGALSNGLELLADEKDPQMRQRCFELLEQSARTSAAKLKYFRLAYGAAGGFGEQVSIDEPKAVIETLAADAKRIELGWQIETPWILTTAGLVNGVAMAIDATTEPGDGVIVMSPVYHAFARVIRASRRELVEFPLALREDLRYPRHRVGQQDTVSHDTKPPGTFRDQHVPARQPGH